MILAIANQKGGVGKTTTAFNLSAALALIGKNTLLVDIDPQAHSTVSLINNSSQYDKSIYDVLVDSEVKISDIIVKTSVPGLEIAISKIAMAKLEPVLLGEIDGHFRLRDVIAPIKKTYEFIIIDTPPTLGLITLNALVAATHIIIPIQSSYLSLEGTDDLLETVIKIRKNVNPDLQVLGVVITLYDRRTNISRDAVERIKRVFGKKVFKTKISKSVKLEESPAYRESIFTYAPDSVGAMQYRKLAQEVIRRAKS